MRHLKARSGRQICPLCNHKKLLVLHHINGRKVDGWDQPWNEVYICASCHDEVHFGLIKIDGYFMTTNGQQLIFDRINRNQLRINKHEAIN